MTAAEIEAWQTAMRKAGLSDSVIEYVTAEALS